MLRPQIWTPPVLCHPTSDPAVKPLTPPLKIDPESHCFLLHLSSSLQVLAEMRVFLAIPLQRSTTTVYFTLIFPCETYYLLTCYIILCVYCVSWSSFSSFWNGGSRWAGLLVCFIHSRSLTSHTRYILKKNFWNEWMGGWMKG